MLSRSFRRTSSVFSVPRGGIPHIRGIYGGGTEKTDVLRPQTEVGRGTMETTQDCPVCYGDLGTPEALCPNGHKVCDTCRPHIYNGVRGQYGQVLPARCPICRHELTRRDAPPPADWNAVLRDPAIRAWREQADVGGLTNVGGIDAVGRRPRNQELWMTKRREFLDLRARGAIPGDAVYGGVHERKCGHRGCTRTGGSQGVRFLLFGNTDKRRYRCEEHTDG